MPLYTITSAGLERVPQTTFAGEKMLERADLQRLLKSNIAALSDDLFVVAEEFCNWEDSRRRIDLLCLDRNAKVVVVELKRTEDGGHMELQALRYAAMVSAMTFDQVVDAHARELGGEDARVRAESAILAFLDWESSAEGQLSDEQRIILVSANFSIELTTAVLWLNRQGLDITCHKAVPHRLKDTVLIDIQQLIPLPEAADFETKLKTQRREAQRQETDRAELFRQFWPPFIKQANARTSIFAGRASSAQHWLTSSSGTNGFKYGCILKADSNRVELYVDLGVGTEAQTMAAYNYLQAKRSEIENNFGAELLWQDLPDSRSCRISYSQPGGSSDMDEWDAIQAKMVDALVRLERALGPHLNAALAVANGSKMGM